MRVIELPSENDFEAWRRAARSACAQMIPPEQIQWLTPGSDASLFAQTNGPRTLEDDDKAKAVRANKAFLKLADQISCHTDPQRFDRLYRLLWRLQCTPDLLHMTADEDVAWALDRQKAIRRDIHKTHAFVRFRQVGAPEDNAFAAWFEPLHRSLRLSAPFFQRRFPNMSWAIITPHESAVWDGKGLSMGAGGLKTDVPGADEVEAQWTRYFQSIFNPARLKVKAMMAEMPKHYWKNLPESAAIPDMIAQAQSRQADMVRTAVSMPSTLARSQARQRFVEQTQSQKTDLSGTALCEKIRSCQKCTLHGPATQAVPGEGPSDARLMIVGEQPGDLEDIAGRPFVGPAGKLLDHCLGQAAIDRSEAYVTNAVKHFKFRQTGKRRLHMRPSTSEIDHCRWWLEQERARVQPRLIIGLGATAMRALLGKGGRLLDVRGKIVLQKSQPILITIHPSYLLRLPPGERQKKEMLAFMEDLSNGKTFLDRSVMQQHSI